MSRITDIGLWNFVKAKIRPLHGRPASPSLAKFGAPVRGRAGLLAPMIPGRIDLHGDTIEVAHARVRSYLSAAHAAGYTSVEVVTGRSGEICREFPIWAALHPDERRTEALNGGGAFRVHLRRK